MRHSRQFDRIAIVTLLALLCFLPRALGADSDSPPIAGTTKENPYVWKPKTRSVSVFKNGYGFFTRQATVALHEGWGHAADVPPATFGTLAIYSQDPKQLVDIVGVGDGELIRFEVPGDDPVSPESRRTALTSALGTSVKLVVRSNEQMRDVEGVVEAISGEYVVLQQGNTSAAIAIHSIQSLQRATLPLRFHVLQDEKKTAESVDLHMAYLRSGIVWIPEYTLKLIDEETAELTLRGTLINDAEDLIDCDVNFVVGVPHFVHTDLLSPLAVGLAIRALGTAMPIGGIPPQVMSQVMNRAVIANNFNGAVVANGDLEMASSGTREASTEFAAMMSNLPQIESVGAGDYNVYTKEKLTLRRGERATVILMSKRIKYGHQYFWNTDSEIEHQLSLENNTTNPWTTGPCLALAGSQPLSEDVLKYTPVNGQGKLTVTTAINIAKGIQESEVDRQLKAHEPQHSQFLDLVTVAGTLKIKSHENQPIQIRIIKKVLGKPIVASHDGAIAIDSEKLRLIERNGTIEWRLTLQPGEAYDLTYRFERFVPSF